MSLAGTDSVISLYRGLRVRRKQIRLHVQPVQGKHLQVSLLHPVQLIGC